MRWLIFILFFIALSCQRKPLYLQDNVAFAVTFNVEAEINAMWDASWADSLLFDWDENTLGKLGYTPVEDFYITLYAGQTFENRVSAVVDAPQIMEADPERVYNITIHNTTENIKEDGHYLYTEVQTKADASGGYSTISHPGEVFSCCLKNVIISDLPYKRKLIDGKEVHVYDINTTVSPSSYIYILQVIVIDDVGLTNLAINHMWLGDVASHYNLLYQDAEFKFHTQIEAENIHGPQVDGEIYVFASRITTFGTHTEESSSSWYSSDKNRQYLTLKLDCTEYRKISGSIDVTEQFTNQPKGGIITVKVRTSDFNIDGDEGTFGITLTDWQSTFFDL